MRIISNNLADLTCSKLSDGGKIQIGPTQGGCGPNIWIPDEASNGAFGVNPVNLFCYRQNVLDLKIELFFMLVKYCLYYMTILIEKYGLYFKNQYLICFIKQNVNSVSLFCYK